MGIYLVHDADDGEEWAIEAPDAMRAAEGYVRRYYGERYIAASVVSLRVRKFDEGGGPMRSEAFEVKIGHVPVFIAKQVAKGEGDEEG